MTGRNWFRLSIANRSIVIMLAVWVALATSLSASAQFGGGDAEKEAAEEAEKAARADAEMKGRQLKELAEQLQQAQQAFAQAERAYAKEREARAVDRAEGDRSRATAREAEQQPAVADEQLRRMRAEFEEARAQLQLFATQFAQAKAQLVPKDGEFMVFALRNSRASDAARLLSQILGGKLMRMAVDDRTNSLVVFADKDTGGTVEALLSRLDHSKSETKNGQPGETLQLRIVWLLDGVEGMDPTVAVDTGTNHSEGLVSPKVLEALGLLGFKAPNVVCQQVTTLTLAKDNREQGQFQFAVPVLINGRLWRLDGKGLVTPAAGERLAVQFELQVGQAGNADGAELLRSRLEGSINSPLGHYTVLGTSTFVDGRGGENPPKQHLSAYVVYLDRAPEFPAAQQAKGELKNAQ